MCECVDGARGRGYIDCTGTKIVILGANVVYWQVARYTKIMATVCQFRLFWIVNRCKKKKKKKKNGCKMNVIRKTTCTVIDQMGLVKRKGASNMLKMRTFRSSCTCDKNHWGLCCLLIHSVVSNVSDREQ